MIEHLKQRLGSSYLENVDASPNITIQIGARRGRVQDVHFVYRSSVRAIRATDLDSAIEGALSLLHTFAKPPPGCVRLNVRALIRNGRAALVSDVYANILDTHRRRLERDDWTLLPYNPLAVDPATCEVVLPIDPTTTSERVGDATDSRRVAIEAILAPLAERVAGAPSPAYEFSQLIRLVDGREQRIRGADVLSLARLLRQVAFVPVFGPNDRDVLAAIQTIAATSIA